jgi:hypothetical protein
VRKLKIRRRRRNPTSSSDVLKVAKGMIVWPKLPATSQS